MPATVILGIFSAPFIIYAAPDSPATITPGYCVIPNNTSGTVTFNSVVFTDAVPGSGAHAAYSAPLAQFPVTVNPGSSVIFEIDLHEGALFGGTIPAIATFMTNTAYTPTIPVQVAGASVGQSDVGVFPNPLQWPVTKVGLSSTFANYVIVNPHTVAITVSALGLTTGTDFFLVGAPVPPFIIPANSNSALFSVQFSPTATGSRVDLLTATTNASGVGPGGSYVANVGGIGSTLQSAFNLTGNTSGTLFAFPNAGAPLTLVANPLSLNCEEAGSFVKLSDFSLVASEKQLIRVRGHYEDLGPAVMLVTTKTRRIGQPDQIVSDTVPIGTVFADGWPREFIADINNAGELIQITFSRAPNSGPVSIIDYIPELVQKGEVIEGT